MTQEIEKTRLQQFLFLDWASAILLTVGLLGVLYCFFCFLPKPKRLLHLLWFYLVPFLFYLDGAMASKIGSYPIEKIKAYDCERKASKGSQSSRTECRYEFKYNTFKYLTSIQKQSDYTKIHITRGLFWAYYDVE